MPRRRTLLAAGALSSLLATMGGCSTSGSEDVTVAAASPTETATRTTATDPTAGDATAADVIASGRLAALASTGSARLGVFQDCPTSADDVSVCRSAWTVPEAHASGLLPGQLSWTVTASDGRFVLAQAGGRRALVVDDSGTTRPVRTVTTPLAGTALRDAVPVSGPRRYDLVDPASATRSPVPRPDGVRRWQTVTADGAGGLWAFAFGDGTPGPMDVWHSADGDTWSRSRIELPRSDTAFPAYLVADGTHAAALAGYDGATLLPVAALAVTADAGRGWAVLGSDDVPFTFVDGMTTAPDGSLYVLGETDRRGAVTALFRSTDDSWTTFATVDLPDGLQPSSITRTADGVVVDGGSGYVVLGDGGTAGPVQRFPR